MRTELFPTATHTLSMLEFEKRLRKLFHPTADQMTMSSSPPNLTVQHAISDRTDSAANKALSGSDGSPSSPVAHALDVAFPGAVPGFETMPAQHRIEQQAMPQSVIQLKAIEDMPRTTVPPIRHRKLCQVTA